MGLGLEVIGAFGRQPLALALAALLFGASCRDNKGSAECNGGVAHGAKPPKGNLFWCADDSGRKHGPYKEWWPNGTLKVDAMYREGVADGPFVAYHDNGKPKEQGNYKGGLRIGKWQDWHPDGNLRRDSEYLPENAVRFTVYYDGGGTHWVEGVNVRQQGHGHFIEWATNGTKIAEGEYKDGQRLDETWLFWNDDGTPSVEPRGTLVTGDFNGQ